VVILFMNSMIFLRFLANKSLIINCVLLMSPIELTAQIDIAFVDGSPLSAFKNRLIPYLIS